MKLRLALIIIVLAIVSYCEAAPAEKEDITGQLVDKMPVHDVNEFISNANRELGENLPLLDAQTLSELAEKGISLDWRAIQEFIFSRLFSELSANSHLMAKLLFLAVLCALLQNLQNSFERSAISLLAYSICHIFLMVIVLTAFYNAISLARTTVGNMVGFLEALLPLLISLLAGVGAFTSAALFTPLMLFVVGAVSLIVKNVVLPFIFLAALLQCVNFFSDRYRITNLSNLLRQSGMVLLGLTLVVFIGIITVQGVAGGVADGVALRTAKYATSTFIPVVGKMLADTVEMVMGASLLLKNGVGLFGIVIVFLLCAVPLIKLAALAIIIKVSGAIVQPMGDEKMAKCLEVVGDNLLLVFGAVAAVVLMFFLIIVMIVGVGNVTTMLR